MIFGVTYSLDPCWSREWRRHKKRQPLSSAENDTGVLRQDCNTNCTICLWERYVALVIL